MLTKHLRLILVVLSISSLAMSCRSLYDKTNFVKSNAAGQISSQEWKFFYAYTDAEAKKPEGIEHIIVLTSSKPTNQCPDASERAADARELVLGIDGKLGEMKIGGSTGHYETADELFSYSKKQRQGSAAFFDPSKQVNLQYQFATSGKIKITKITTTTIEGFVLAKLNPENFANGRFKAKICKWGQLN